MKTLAFLDSGIGGIPYLLWTKALLPHELYVYCADNKGFPYGTKTEIEIQETFSSMIQRLLKHRKPDIFVVACNTASVVALDYLRKTFPFTFIGVVPAIKPAAHQSKNKRIGVLATERTIKGKYLQNLADTFAPECTIFKRPASELIAAIEADPLITKPEIIKGLLKEIKTELLAENVDSIVLGCTHFLMCEELFISELGQDFSIVDSRDGVANRILEVLNINKNSDQQNTKQPTKTGEFYLTAPSQTSKKYEDLAKIFNLEFCGVLND